MTISDDQKKGDALLAWWGKWIKTSPLRGYGSMTVEGRLIKQGVLIPTINKLEETDEMAEKVENIIVTMPPKMKKVVKVEYLSYSTREIKQRRAKMGRYQYEQLLREAQLTVARHYHENGQPGFISAALSK